MKLKQLPDGRWRVSFQTDKQHRLIFRTKKQAEDATTKARDEWVQRRITPNAYKASIGFKEICEKYLTQYAIPNGQEKDAYYLPYFWSFLGEATPIGAITPERLKELKAKLLLDFAASTFIRRWTLLSSVFREAVVNGYLPENPCRKVNNKAVRKKISRKDTARIRWFTDDEMQLIYQELLFPTLKSKHASTDGYTAQEKEENMLYAQVARNTGLRPDSLDILEWRDLDMQHDVLTARETKNGKTYHFALNVAARKAFLRLWELKSKPNQGKVFRRANWSRIFTKLFRRLGWNSRSMEPRERAVLYSFRHTFASHLVMNGYEGKALMDAMGWDGISEIQTYAHLSPKFKATMANTVSCEYIPTGDRLLQEAKAGQH